MSRLHTQIRLTVELLTPLHIGSGTELLLGYDLLPHHGRTYRVNEDTLLDTLLPRAEAEGPQAVKRLLSGRPAGELLAEADLSDPHSRLFRYTMPGVPSAVTAGARVREQIKDVYDHVYLPGSSLKGALRTVLAWGMYASQKRRPDLGRLGRQRTWAAQRLERDLFGPDPNHDFLRAWHIEDSRALPAEGSLALRTVLVHPTATESSQGLPIDLEVVERGTVFQTMVTIEEYGFGEQVAPELNWQEKRRWADRLPTLAWNHARQRLRIEAEHFSRMTGVAAVCKFYAGLIENLPPKPSGGELLLQIGWGTGWESKTLGTGLIRGDDDAAFEALLQDYDMTRGKKRRLGDPFPKTRHLVLDPKGRPVLPLGWVRVKWEKLPA